MSLSGPSVAPRSGGAPRQLVVILHGYGADGDDLIGLGQHWSSLMPDALFLAPNAPTRCAQNSFGFEWFPIDFEDMNRSVGGGAPLAREVVAGALGDFWSQTGLGPAQTLLVGFSQGAMMALHVALRRPRPIAGVVGYSGMMIDKESVAAEIRSRPPVLLIHGDADPVVPFASLHEAVGILSDLEVPAQWHVSPRVGHGIAPDGLAAGAQFLKNAFRDAVKPA